MSPLDGGITIWDVAGRAGVSKSTVSRFINNNGPVSAAAAVRIREAISALGYVPDSSARAMRTRRTWNLVFIIPDYANPFFIEMYKGIEVRARARGYTVQMMSASSGGADFPWQSFLRHRVDGILMNCSYDHRSAAIRRFRDVEREFPVVFMDPWTDKGVPFSSVVADGRSGNAEAVDYLVRSGRRRIAFLRGRRRILATRDRWLGYADGLRRNGLTPDPRLVKECSFAGLLESGYRATLELMRDGIRFDSLVAICDIMAIGAMKALSKLGVRVPEDVAVVGFDNISMCEIVEPNLTSIAQPADELGRAALELLLRHVEDGRGEHESIVLPTRLVVRRSTDATLDDRREFGSGRGWA